jgi:crotonobetainyl-CoA:carnitine CoA-transferase CaiB-like acyl-CoA transferase
LTFLLNGIRVADLSWLLAGAGTSAIPAHRGAEVIRVEWPGRLEFMRAPPAGGHALFGVTLAELHLGLKFAHPAGIYLGSAHETEKIVR